MFRGWLLIRTRCRCGAMERGHGTPIRGRDCQRADYPELDRHVPVVCISKSKCVEDF